MKLGKTYKALVAKKTESGFQQSVENLRIDDLPQHDVLVRVRYSSLNYKDALSATGDPGVTQNYPHTPGIDAAGVVEESKNHRFKKGDSVIVTSYDLGQNTPGGFGQYICVPGKWIVPLPPGLSLKESMMIGTSGFTAAYGVKKIMDQGIMPESGKLLVSGATGGVGSFAVALLAQLGFSVTAATGKTDQADFLKNLGAQRVIKRVEVTTVKDRPLLSSRWVGALDTVGGAYLDAILRQTSHNGVVTCCGNILGGELITSIYPFILRGISLMGIDSGICLMKDRLELWKLLSDKWKPEKLEQMCREVHLEDLPGEIQSILNGKQCGKVIITLPD